MSIVIQFLCTGDSISRKVNKIPLSVHISVVKGFFGKGFYVNVLIYRRHDLQLNMFCINFCISDIKWLKTYPDM